MTSRKICEDPFALARHIEADRDAIGPVVLANGCFDVLHIGHVRYLEAAASLGNLLVVAMNNDRSTRALKGDGRPVIPEMERAEMLLAIRHVDYVLIFGDKTVDRILEILRPDFHAKGTDYTVETVPERETAGSIGCTTVIVGDPKDHASRDIIGKLRGEGRGGSR